MRGVNGGCAQMVRGPQGGWQSTAHPPHSATIPHTFNSGGYLEDQKNGCFLAFLPVWPAGEGALPGQRVSQEPSQPPVEMTGKALLTPRPTLASSGSGTPGRGWGGGPRSLASPLQPGEWPLLLRCERAWQALLQQEGGKSQMENPDLAN